MLLQIVPLARNESDERFPIRKLHPRDFTIGGIRFLGFHGEELRADALLLVATLEGD